jgi:hypothetical protein
MTATPERFEIVAPLRGKDFGQSCGGIRLKARCAEIAQHGVIAGLVSLVERQHGRADEDEDAIAIDLRRLRRGGRGVAQRASAPVRKRQTAAR